MQSEGDFSGGSPSRNGTSTCYLYLALEAAGFRPKCVCVCMRVFVCVRVRVQPSGSEDQMGWKISAGHNDDR